MLVPALAVDRAGNRLGRGGGSYDRALARVGPLIPLIALVYDGELLDHVPAERHDVPVRAAVSPLTGITVLAREDDPLPRGDSLLPRDTADPMARNLPLLLPGGPIPPDPPRRDPSLRTPLGGTHPPGPL